MRAASLIFCRQKTPLFVFLLFLASRLIGSTATESPVGDDERKVIYVIRHGEKTAGDVAAGQLGHEEQCLSEKGWARAYNLRSIFGRNPRDGFRTPDAIYAANYNSPLSCKDRHGWYRTEQTVSVVAKDLGIQVNNTLGFFPGVEGCEKKWLPEAMSKFREWNANQTNEFPQWALDKLDAWAPEQPTLESTDYASTGVCCPYGNAADTIPEYKDCPTSCCNEEAGAAILEALMMDDVNTILVAWEHFNIGYLMAALGVTDYDAKDWDDKQFDTFLEIVYDDDGNYVTYHQGDQEFEDPISAGEDQFLGPTYYCGAINPTAYPVELNGTTEGFLNGK